jgi:hypothetical protein
VSGATQGKTRRDGIVRCGSGSDIDDATQPYASTSSEPAARDEDGVAATAGAGDSIEQHCIAVAVSAGGGHDSLQQTAATRPAASTFSHSAPCKAATITRASATMPIRRITR